MAEFSQDRLELIVIKVNWTEMDDFLSFLGTNLVIDFFTDNFSDLLLFDIFCD